MKKIKQKKTNQLVNSLESTKKNKSIEMYQPPAPQK